MVEEVNDMSMTVKFYIYNMSDCVVSGIQCRVEGESCISDTAQTQMACETLRFYRSIDEVVFKIHRL